MRILTSVTSNMRAGGGRVAAVLLSAVFAALVAAPVPAHAADAEPLDKIIAVVNDAPITRQEIEREMRRLRRERADLPDARARMLALNYLIDRQLQLQRARLFEVNVADALVEQRLDEIRRELGLAERADWEAVLETRFALSPEELRQQVREDLQMQALFFREVYAYTEAYGDEIDQFLKLEAEGVLHEREYHLRHILIPFDADDADGGDGVSAATRNAQEALALSLRARALAGEDFAALARAYSAAEEADSGGDLGFRAETDMPDRFVRTVLNLRPGDISEPIITSRGFHLLKLEAARGGELREQVRQYNLSHIFFDLDAAADARAVYSELTGEADFLRAVREHTRDSVSRENEGSIGWFDERSLPSYFADAVRDMQEGDISAPLQSPFGWHILYLAAVRDEKFDIQGLRDQARQLLRERRALGQRDIWLRRLRNNAYVRILDPAFELETDGG